MHLMEKEGKQINGAISFEECVMFTNSHL